MREKCNNFFCKEEAEYKISLKDGADVIYVVYICQEHLVDAVDALKDRNRHVDVDRLGDK